ncbi:MAG TPA: PAS domain S-box protein, partial [Methanomassiliicoccales archaeon]|nr:PAS domain S-box protein [Methanomassiliicoccales archaeon]
MARASRILLVDDEIAILEITKEFLEFTVASSIDTASTVQEALDKLKGERYDAIVSDYQMPGMNGIEFLRKVRESDATIAFVLFTGKGREEVAIEAINSGADFYIKKGGEATAQFAELGNAVNQAIARRQAERAHAQAEELYTSLYNNLLDVFYVHDLNGNFLDVNPAGVSQFGYGLDEARKLNFLDILHPDDRQRASSTVKDLIESGRMVGTREYRVRRRDGEYVTVEVSSSVLKRDGVPVAVQGVARDVSSRKRLENALRENEAFLDRVVSKSPVGVLVLDGRELRVRLMNQHYQQNFLDEPYHATKLVGKKLEEFIPGIENTEVPALLHRVADTGVPFIDNEYRFTGFKRGVTYWNMAYHQIQLEGEKGVLVVANEVTEQVVARMAVESSEAKYRSLFDSMQDAYGRVDMEGHIIDSNEAYRRMLGYTTDELANLTYPDVTPQKWHEMEEKIVADAFLRGHSEVYEKEYIRKDGTVFPVELHAFVIKGADGKPTGMWGIARDITERKRAESELRKSEGRYRSLIESLTDAYVRVDLQGRFVECNSAFKRLTGYSDEELDPITTMDLTPPRWRKVQEEMVRRTIATGSSGTVEKELFRKDGTTVPVMMNTYLIRDDLGQPVGRWSIMHDITDVKRAETALAREHGLGQNYLDLAGFIFIGLDKEHKITILNRKGCEILGIGCQD